MATNSEPGRYVGLNKHDIASCLRRHAQEIADGERNRPVRSVVCDIDPSGDFVLMLYGTDCGDPREAVQLLTDVIRHATATIATFNRMASN